MVILTKDSILKGINNPQKVMIKSLDGELWLRPLSSAEVHEVTNIEAQGFGTFNATNNRGQTMADGKMNLAKMQDKQNEAKYTAIEKSINNDKNSDTWTMVEIQLLPSNAIDEIYNAVMELSGVETTEEDVKQFLENE